MQVAVRGRVGGPGIRGRTPSEGWPSPRTPSNPLPSHLPSPPLLGNPCLHIPHAASLDRLHWMKNHILVSSNGCLASVLLVVVVGGVRTTPLFALLVPFGCVSAHTHTHTWRPAQRWGWASGDEWRTLAPPPPLLLLMPRRRDREGEHGRGKRGGRDVRPWDYVGASSVCVFLQPVPSSAPCVAVKDRGR